MKRKKTHSVKRGPKDKASLEEAAKAVHAKLPDHHGFILLAMPFEGGGDRLTYISNLEHTNAIHVLKEFLIKAGAEEDWMKHLK